MSEEYLLDSRLEAYLDSLRPTPPRNTDEADRGRAAFLEEAASLGVPVSSRDKWRLKGWIIPLWKKRKEKSPMMTILTTLLVTLTLALGGTSATVYAAQNSLPDDFLYPLKTFTEDVQLGLRSDPQDQFDLLFDFTARRFKEINVMVDTGEPIPAKAAVRLQQQMSTMLKLAAGMDDAQLHQALMQIQAALQAHNQVMTNLMAQRPDQVDPMMTQLHQRLQTQQRLVNDGLSEPNLFRQRINSAGNHPGEYPEPTPKLGEGKGLGPGNRTARPEPTATGTLTTTATATPDQDSEGPGPGPGGDGDNNGQGPGEPQPAYTNTPKQGEDDKGDGPKATQDSGKKDPGKGGGNGGKP